MEETRAWKRERKGMTWTHNLKIAPRDRRRLLMSLAGHYESTKLELQGAWEPPGSSKPLLVDKG
jgi:hypothetical protein